MQSPSGTQQENPIATTSNIVPGLATPVFQPTNSYVGPTTLSWSGPQVSPPAPPTTDNASLIRELMKHCQSATKAMPEDIRTSVTKTKTASNVFASNSQQKETNKQAPPSSTNTYSRCIVCNGNHRLWECRVFKKMTPTQRAKLVADNKFCFSCSRDKHTIRQCPQPRKCRAEGCNSSHNTLLHGADRVFPAKQSTNSDTIQPSGNTGQSTATTSQQPSNKTTTMSSVTDVKRLLHVTELQLVNSSGVDTKALVLCDTACSNSWVAGSLSDRLGSHGKALKLTVKGFNTAEVVDTRVVVKPREYQDFEPFAIKPFVKESLNVGSDIINVQALQQSYPHLAVLDPVTYSYKDIEMILGQDVYHAIRPLEYFSADEKRPPVAVRLPISWVLSGTLPSNSCLTSTCFKVNIEHDKELASQVKSWYDIESFGASKQVDPRSAADARAHKILENTTVHNGLRYDVGMLWAADNTKLPNNYFSSLVQLKSLEKRLAKDEDLREKYTSTIKEDLNKGM